MDEHDDLAAIDALEADVAAIEQELAALDTPAPEPAVAPRPFGAS